jgi:hypothetical protein
MFLPNTPVSLSVLPLTTHEISNEIRAKASKSEVDFGNIFKMIKIGIIIVKRSIRYPLIL